MSKQFLAWSSLGLTVALAAPLLPGAGWLERQAHADEAAGSSCVLKGTHPIAKGTQLFSEATGGRVLATFTGTFVPMQVSELPADGATGRAKLATSTGGGALRLDGWVPMSEVAAYTARDVPIIVGHVWLSQAQKVKLVRASGSTLTAELTVAGSGGQKARATAPCEAFTLQKGSPTPVEIAGNARGFTTKGTSLDLYDSPNGSAVFSLAMQEGTGQLFWSTEQRGGFVHVLMRADLTIDAWARWRDLEAMKRGEMMDQLIPPASAVTGAQLALDKPPPLVRATKEIPVRARRDEKEKPIGVVQVDAEIYVMETVAGWTNILPKSLHVVPPDDGGFWIPAAEAPK